MKKIFLCVLIFVLCVTPCYAKTEKVIFNGIAGNIEAYKLDDVSYVPLKEVCSLLDLNLIFELDSSNRNMLILENKDKSIQLKLFINSRRAYLNGEKISINYAPLCAYNRTYVYLRDICGMFNYTLERNGEGTLCVNYSNIPLPSSNPAYYSSPTLVLNEKEKYEQDVIEISAIMDDIFYYSDKILNNPEDYYGYNGETMWRRLIDVSNIIDNTVVYTKEGKIVKEDCELIILNLSNMCYDLSNYEIPNSDRCNAFNAHLNNLKMHSNAFKKKYCSLK